MGPMLSRKNFLFSLGALLLAGPACSGDDDEGTGTAGSGNAGSGADPEPSDAAVSQSPEPKDAGPHDDGKDGSSPGEPDAGRAKCDRDLVAISSGETHTHTLTIPGADVLAGGSKPYETSEDFGHSHWVELDDADFAILRSGGTVTKTTCSGGDHLYELRCGENLTTTGLPVGCSDECGNTADNLCS